MIPQGRGEHLGRILSTWTAHAHYCTAKFAIRGLTQSVGASSSVLANSG